MDKLVLCVCTLEMDIPIFFSLKDVLTILYTSILHLSFTPSWIAFIIFPPNLVASSNLGAKKLDVSSNRRLYQPKFPTSTHSLHPLAATTNSTSSGRWTRSDRAAPRAAERRAGERKRYSATPITNRHVFSKGATIKKKNGHTNPEHKHWRTSYIQMLIRPYSQLCPTVHHRQKTQMTIWTLFRLHLRRLLPQRKLIQHILTQQYRRTGLVAFTSFFSSSPSKHLFPRAPYPVFQLLSPAFYHQLEQLGRRASVLLDLGFRRRVQHRKPGVDVPFRRIDTKRNVDFDHFNTGDVARRFPWIR